MNQSDALRMTANKAGVPMDVAHSVVTAFLDSVSLALACGEAINLRRFGKFEPRTRSAVMRKNPRTGDLMDIPEKQSVGFVPSINLKARMNGVSR